MSFRPPKTLPILSIFHNAANSQSRAALELLKQCACRSNGSDAYRIDVIEPNQKPTIDQLRQVASYLSQGSAAGGEKHASSSAWKQMVRPDANVQDWSEIATVLHEQPQLIQRPLVVDWSRGKAAIGSPTLDAVEKLLENIWTSLIHQFNCQSTRTWYLMGTQFMVQRCVRTGVDRGKGQNIGEKMMRRM